jgi:predicted permease
VLARVVAFIRGIARRRSIGAEVDDELRFHLEQEIGAHVARGVPPPEARRMALRDLGGLTETKEAVRSVRTIGLEILWRDIRHAVRSLRATPAFSVVALVVLTLSIGATTAIFSVVDVVILRRLPFDRSDRLVAVGELKVKDRDPSSLNPAASQNFLDWRDQQDVFTGLAAVGYTEISLRREGDALPENLRGQRVTAEFFSVLRSPPLLGRPFSADEEREGAARVAVISYGLWQRRFGGRPDIVGARLPTQLASFEIVGVMPPGFTYPVDTYVLGAREPLEIWVPYVFGANDRVRGNSFGYGLHVVGRLRDGVTVRQAQARMEQINAGLAAATPRWFTDRVVKVEPLHELVTRGVRRWMMMLLAAVSCVLLIACVNLANLMLVRATTRTRELAVRASLGASSWDLSRALLLESLLLSLTGAALGVVLAWWGVELLRSAIPEDVPRAAAIVVDLRVLAATAFVAVLCGIAFGLAPVLQFTRPAAMRTLPRMQRTATASTRTRTLRAALVVSEVTLAVVLLVGSALFLASFARVVNVDLGLDYRDVVTVQVRVPQIATDVEQASQRNRRLLLTVLERVRSIPFVQVAALLGGGLPLRGDLRTMDFAIPGRDLPPNTDIAFNQVSPDYFKAVNVPLLKGRSFTEADGPESERVAILNQAAAARYFPGEDAIGKVVTLSAARRVVGIVGNVRLDGPEGAWRTQAYVPVTQSRISGGTLVIRTAPGARGIVPAVRQAVWSEFGVVPTRIDEHTMSAFFDTLVAQRRFTMLLLALFGVLGLTIASAGIYGVMAYVVTERTQEIGIRMALGALPSRILRSILRSASALMMLGIATGLAASWVLAELVEGFLFEVRAHEPSVYAGALTILALAGLVAALVPALRAARVDPVVALRSE